jgi:hypothetical protein
MESIAKNTNKIGINAYKILAGKVEARDVEFIC